MKKVMRITAMALVTVLCLFSLILTGSTDAMAEYTPTLSMLHTSGIMKRMSRSPCAAPTSAVG
jgi:hypothetical protein